MKKRTMVTMPLAVVLTLVMGFQFLAPSHALARGHENTGTNTAQTSAVHSQQFCDTAGVSGNTYTCDNGYEYYCSVTYYVPGAFYAFVQNGYDEYGVIIPINNAPVYDPAACDITMQG